MNKAYRPTTQSLGILLVYISFLAQKSVSSHILPTQDLVEDDQEFEKKISHPRYSSQLENRLTDDTQDDDSDDVVLVPVSKDSLLEKNFIDSITEEEKRQKWIQLQARLRKMFWNHFQKKASVLPLIKNRLRVLNLPKSKNEFQRQNRRSRAMTILRTIAPQFHNGVDPQVQRRLWKDVMAVANTKSYGNEIDVLENERIHPNSKEKYASNDRWITLLKSEEPEGNINKYHYANSAQWPLNALPQLNPQSVDSDDRYPEQAKKFQLNHHYRSK